MLCIGKYRDGFQSTLPVWGATTPSGFKTRMHSISIHAPRVGSDGAGIRQRAGGRISIHAPRVGSDVSVSQTKAVTTKFQSTLPVWGATQTSSGCPAGEVYFNPRSPCGERRDAAGSVNHFSEFQSTLPVWGATFDVLIVLHFSHISIHAPRVGSDYVKSGVDDIKTEFQSTLPVWGATVIVVQASAIKAISIHAPRVGSDACVPLANFRNNHFNPRSPCGERPQRLPLRNVAGCDFNPRSPCGERRIGAKGLAGLEMRFQSTLPVWGATSTHVRPQKQPPYFNPRSPCGERRH